MIDKRKIIKMLKKRHPQTYSLYSYDIDDYLDKISDTTTEVAEISVLKYLCGDKKRTNKQILDKQNRNKLK